MSVRDDQQPAAATPRPHDAALTRRHALGGVVGLGVATPLLAACGGSSDGGGSEGPTGSGPVIGTAEVAVGSAVIVADRNLVVSQPSEGEFRVFSSICTHQGCPVSKVVDGTADCTCHGSRFNITDGSVAQGPAEEGLEPVDFTVEGDQIVVG